MTGSSRSRAYGMGVAVAIIASLLIVWTTIVRDDGQGVGFFMVIMAAGVAGFAASFSAAGMARAMAGAAGMQALLGLAIATAPVTASAPGGVAKVVVFSAFYTAFWLVSATCFRVAARGGRMTAAT